VQVFRAGVMIDAMKSAFQNGPNGFDAVCVDVSAHPLAVCVAYRMMREEQAADAAIDARTVTVQRRANFAELVNRALDCRQVVVGDHECLSVAAPLTHSENRRFTNRAPTLFQFFVFVLRVFLTAHKGFVNFDCAAQLLNVTAAGFSQALQHEPSRLLRYADLFCQLQGRDALTGCNQEIHRINPFVQRDVAALEYRACPDREILFTGVATIEAFALPSRDVLAFADRTERAIRPQARLKINASRFLIGNQLEQLKRCLLCFDS
jgi:hypothetical protein